MPAFFQSKVCEFLSLSDSELVGMLARGYAAARFTDMKTAQTESWAADCVKLREALRSAVDADIAACRWDLLLEFAIPRKEKRVDAILLLNGRIVVIEFKSGMPTSEHRRQVEEYALLLHYFHQPSNGRSIIPLLLSDLAFDSTLSRQRELAFEETAAYWIDPVTTTNWRNLARLLREISMTSPIGEDLDGEAWNLGAYWPVPTIIDAALSLARGLEVREIASSSAETHEIDALTEFLQKQVDAAKEKQCFSICFLTGVPGSGKTLVGLNLAFSRRNVKCPIHFMSGNGPLVKILQTVLARNEMAQGVPAARARLNSATLIENVHVFARTYAEELKGQSPSNNVIIFDEAQRAWDRAQNERKFRRPYSEPEMLIEIMERQPGWAVVVALVGGGQEINDGEAGIGEWGRALSASKKRWEIFASPEVIYGGASVAGSKLAVEDADRLHLDDRLHLKVSKRSLRSERLAEWVNLVIEGEWESASSLGISATFPLFLTRDLTQLREQLKHFCFGERRSGLVGSSGAARLRAEGLEPNSSFHADYPWEYWYLGERTDIRSSYSHEVFATEFEVQGLELDWIGLCWGGDFVWEEQKQNWLCQALRPGRISKWSAIKSERRAEYKRNAYRVLMTRARQGMILFVPRGSNEDTTRDAKIMDATAEYLLRCGMKELPG